MQDTQQLQSAISNYPLPLAQALRRAVNAKSPQEQHNGAYYFFESALKLSAAAQLGVYFSLGCPHGPLNALLENLTRPSVGHWLALLRETSAYLAARQDHALLPLNGAHERLVTKKQMPAAKAFLEFAARTSDKHEARQSFRILDLFDAVVSYRNQELGHGAMRERAFYAEASPLLLEAVLEAVNLLRPVGDLQFVVARDVVDPRTQKASRRFDVLRGDGLHLPLDAAQPRDAEIAAGRLLLAGGATRVSLHPLLVYEIDKLDRDRVGFLNHVAASGRGDTQKLKRVEYLDYDSGERMEGHDALEELATLLSKVRGQAVSIEAVAALSQGGAEANIAQASSDKGQFIGDFELLEELGRGGMGIVYKARQNSLRRIVALKVLPPGVAGDPVSVARFKREIAALGRCDHPNVVKVLTAGQDGERHFYAMEYVEGSDLAQVCGVLSQWKTGALKEGHILKAITDSRAQRSAEPGKVSGALSQREKDPEPIVPKAAEIVPEISEGRDYFTRLAEILGDAASGVQHLHEHGIIHRDLKPANVMLTGDGRRAVIMDLGLAQLQDRSLSLTASSVKILGTLRYMPPEQLQHQMLEVTPKADIYSLGATLYELAALAPMFDGDTEARLMQQVLQEEPKPARSHNGAIPRDLETIITVATAKAPADRYTSAGALASDLRAFARGEPISARAPTTFHYLKLFYRKNTRLVQGMATAVAVLLVLTAWFILSLDESRAQAESSAQTARRKEAEARSEAERANRAEKDAQDKAAMAQKAREEADRQKGLAEAKTREVEAALKEAARNLQQIYTERGLAASERGEAALALNCYAQAATLAEELGDVARFKQAWDQFCLVEPRVPFEMWRTEQNGFAQLQLDIAVSADGAVMAGMSDESVVCVEIATGRTLLAVRGSGYISRADLCSDGTLLLLASWNSLQLWNVRTGTKIADLECADTEAKGACFRSGDKVVQVIYNNGQAREFDTATGKQLTSASLCKQVYSTAYSPDGKHLLVYGFDDYFDLYLASGLKLLTHARNGINYVRNMALAPGGNVALICGDSGKIEAWDVAEPRQLATLAAQCSYGRAIAFSLSGSAAVVSGTGDVALFDGDWQKPRVFKTAASRAQSICFMPDGITLVVGQSRAPPWVLDSRDGRRVTQGIGFGSSPLCASFSPDHSLVAIGTFGDGIVLLDAATGRQLRVLNKVPVLPMQIVWLPHGRHLATFGASAGGFEILDIETGERVLAMQVIEGDERICAMAGSPDGRFLYVSTNSGRIVRCSADGTERKRVFAANRGEVRGMVLPFIRVSPDGRVLTVADNLGSVTQLAADDGSLLRYFDGRAERGELLALNHAGTSALFGIKQDRLFVRELATGKEVRIEFDASKPPIMAEFTAAGELVTVDTDHCIRAYSAATGTARILMQGTLEKPAAMLLDDAARSIVLAYANGAVRYALETARRLVMPPIGQGEVFDLLWLRGSSLLAAGGLGAPVQLVDMDAGRVVDSFGGKALARTGLCLSPDGGTLLCGGMASHVVAFDLALHKARDLYAIPQGRIVFSTDFSPDGGSVALAQCTEGNENDGSSVVLLNATTGALIREVKTGTGLCVCARFIAEGRELLVGSINARPAIYDVATGKRLSEFGEVCEQSLAFAVNAAHSTVVVPGKENELDVFELPSLKKLGVLAGHTSRVTRAIFSPDGTRIATISSDATVRLWDIRTGVELGKTACDHATDITGLAFTPDGDALIFSDRVAGCKLWNVDDRRVLSTVAGLRAADITALARHLTHMRLEGFEARPFAAAEQPLRWDTADGKAPVPLAWPRVDAGAELAPALKNWQGALAQWLKDWLVARPQQSWRQRYAAWRYLETKDERGVTRETGVASSAPWEARQRVGHTAWWECEQYRDDATLYFVLWRSEEEERWQDALETALELEQRHADDLWLLFRKGRAAMKLRAYADAYRAFKALLEVRGDLLCVQAMYGVVLARRDYTVEALKLLDKAVAAGLGNAEIHMCRGLCLRSSNLEQAEAEFRKAVALDPRMVEAWSRLAMFLADHGKSEEAEQCYSKALEQDPSHAVLYSLRATLKRKRSDLEGAIADLSRSIELRQSRQDTSQNGTLAEDYVDRAELYLLTKQYQSAIDDFSLSLLADGWTFLGRCLEGRGAAYMQTGRILEAFNDYTAWIEADQDDASLPCRLLRAQCAATLGDPLFAWADIEFVVRAEGLNTQDGVFAARVAAQAAQMLTENKCQFPCHTDDARKTLEDKYRNASAELRSSEAAQFVSRAFERLNDAAAKGYNDADALEKDAALQALRSDARWAALLATVKANRK